ncbi:putative toxin-antitoxin system toxin component, PIN family [Aquiflexum lacus]|uniref:putative toxin-antitoxin system toxin component, PIN family n=1 Tax=Aquiflexum lacus TaxID=2483805 RepID=UPI001894AAEB|nr:putative toxin-antitoxin system toxin component, PIN family [Aquiflexum lacus]
MKNRRVILDTNLWISFLISKRQGELDMLLESGAVTLIFSKELLEEFLVVSERPKFKKFFKKSHVKALLTQIETFGELKKVGVSLKNTAPNACLTSSRPAGSKPVCLRQTESRCAS